MSDLRSGVCSSDLEAIVDCPADEGGDHRSAPILVIRRMVGPVGGWSKSKRTRSPVLRSRVIVGSRSRKVMVIAGQPRAVTGSWLNVTDLGVICSILPTVS